MEFKVRTFLYTILHYTIINSYPLQILAMESVPNNPQQSNSSSQQTGMPQLGKIYYELTTLQNELEYLKKCMERMHHQHNLVDYFYTFKETIENNDSVAQFHLNTKKDLGSLLLNLVESQVTLHASSCKDTSDYSLIKQKLHQLYTASNEIIKKQVESLKTKSKDYSFMEHFAHFFSPYTELVNHLPELCAYWFQAYDRYRVIHQMCTHFEDRNLRLNIIKNIFGHEIITALLDQFIVTFQKDLAAAVCDDTITTNTREAIVKRFASLYDTPTGKLLNPKKTITVLEQRLGPKAFKKKHHPEIRLLILEKCTLYWIKEHQSAVKKALENIKTKITGDSIEQLIEPGGKPPQPVTEALSRIHDLYVKLSLTK